MSGPRPVRAARGTELNCLGWPQEAAYRMMHNNLDPEVAERPDDLVVYGGTGRAGAQLGRVRRDGAHVDHVAGRRDDAGAVGQAGRRVPHPRVGAAGAARQQQPGARVGHLGRVPPPRGDGPDDVRPDDRRLVDLHRHAGHPAGHLRVLRRDRPPQVRRQPGRHDHPDRRPGRHGRCAAAGGHDERRRGAVRRRRSDAGAAPPRDALPRRARRWHRRRDRPVRARPRRTPRAVGRAGRQRRRAVPEAARAWTSRPTSSPTRPAPTTRSATCPPT